MIKELRWDSDFFGIAAGEWDIKNQPGDTALFDVIYAKSTEEIKDNLKGFSRNHSEKRVVFTKQLNKVQTIDSSILSFEKSGFNKEELYPAAFESGKYSRFKLDKKFGEENFRRLYKTWIDNSINRKLAHNVLIYIQGDKIVGIITYKIENYKGIIGLFGILPSHQGRGIGRKLLEYVEQDLIGNNIKELNIPTQMGNIPACSFYKKMGYIATEISYITHFWKDDSI